MVVRRCVVGARTLSQNGSIPRRVAAGFSCLAIAKDQCTRSLSLIKSPRYLLQTRAGHWQARKPDYEPRPPIIPCSDSDVVGFFRTLLPPLEFPENVAVRMVTHNSWRDGAEHNNRQAFMGRRVLNAYLMTFFHAHTTLTPTPPLTQPPSEPPADLKISQLPSPNDTLEQNFDNLSDLVLHTRTLGEHVGAAWQLERVMRWVPNFDHHTSTSGIRANEGESSGLYKIRGTTVEAVVGGVFYQFGGVAAHRLFHTRVLPYLTFLLPAEYRKPAQAASKRLGGPSAPVLLSTQSSHL
ncbi:hypothetical protein RSOLAG1IB_05360 [Rhizoctonia solani AG-1 IB]|uniref:RNase III domain-containing protein n=1 Tax=Thanatephorus cucumeris (strain AG1-IB / isolate 7/3/14) TaxID=1108050 RepID=A0A0B7FZC9_THACB|nr:hypothetical protein RSOLAG1IB_05360 [Rhizoctonia solani AG-1 IB]